MGFAFIQRFPRGICTGSVLAGIRVVVGVDVIVEVSVAVFIAEPKFPVVHVRPVRGRARQRAGWRISGQKRMHLYLPINGLSDELFILEKEMATVIPVFPRFIGEGHVPRKSLGTDSCTNDYSTPYLPPKSSGPRHRSRCPFQTYPGPAPCWRYLP